MSELDFARPWFLAGAVIAPLMLAAWRWRIAAGLRTARNLSRRRPSRPPVLGTALVALAMALAVVAAAQPRLGTKKSLVPRSGADVIVVLDVSRSMDVQDVPPSRLEAAKAQLALALDRLDGDRVGLVIFAGSARLRFPLTTDINAAKQVIASIESAPALIEAGTSAAAGIDVAIEAFADAPDQAGRLILLVTDGEDLGPDAAGASERLRASGAALLVAGVGTTQGGPVPVYDRTRGTWTTTRRADGSPVISQLNEAFLRALAVAGGGRYLGSELASLPGALDSRVSALKRARIEEEAADIPVERYQLVAAFALGALLLGMFAEWLPARGRRRMALLAGPAMALLLASGCATQAHDLNAEGIAAYRAGDYERAVERFLQARSHEPDNPRISLNLAAALQEAGRYEESITASRRALVSRDERIRAEAHARAGRAHFAAGRPERALESFRSALLADPRDGLSRHDYEVILRLLQPPPAPDDSGDGEPGEGTPSPGQGTQPGGTPQPGGGTPAAGTPSPGPATPAAGATPPAGQPTQSGPGTQADPNATAQALDRQIQAIDRQIARILQEAEGEPSAEEAVRILTLFEQRERLAQQRASLGGAPDPNDR